MVRAFFCFFTDNSNSFIKGEPMDKVVQFEIPYDSKVSASTFHFKIFEWKLRQRRPSFGRLTNSLILFSMCSLLCFLPEIVFGDTCLQYTSEHKSEEAVIACSAAIKAGNLDKGNLISTHANRARAYSETGSYDLAIADLTAALALDPKWHVAYQNRGFAYARKGDYKKAIEDFNKAIELHPEYASAYMNFGHLYQMMGLYELAIAQYAKAYNLNPSNELAIVFKMLAAGKISLKKERQEKEQLRSIVKASPVRLKFWIASKYFLDEADLADEDVFKSFQNDNMADYDRKFVSCTCYYYIGEKHLEKGESKKALTYFQKSMETKMYANPTYHLSKMMIEWLAVRGK